MGSFFTFRAERRRSELRRLAKIAARRRSVARTEPAVLIRRFGLADGLTEEQVENMRDRFGANRIVYSGRDSFGKRLAVAFVNPFTSVLMALAAVSFLVDVYWAAPAERNPTAVIIIIVMVLISGLLRFIQETRSGNAAMYLNKMVKTTATVERNPEGKIELPLEELVVGDLVHLAAGDMLPGDVRILKSKDFFVNQASLTGESEPVEKSASAVHGTSGSADCRNLAFAGSNVVSGSATALVIAVGGDTLFGAAARSLAAPPPPTGFEKGVNSVSWVLIRFMLIMVPVVFLINGFTKGNWEAAFLFAISVAVGLTPEMLPMIVTTCLAKGAVQMSRCKTIVKNLNAIQNLGAMDLLCTDKTGTLTLDQVVLEYHMNVEGESDPRVLRHAFLNSYYQTGLKNLLDRAIMARQEENGDRTALREIIGSYEKVDEIPFDFERRRMSVVVADRHGKTQLITKGAVEEMLGICSEAEYGGKVEPLTAQLREKILATAATFNRDGMRVLAVAQKNHPAPAGAFSMADECGMTLIGYLAFLDPPKPTAEKAISTLRRHGVATKVLTGDNEKITRCICRKVGLSADNLLLGDDLEKMSENELAQAAERTNVFAKLDPEQKARLVRALRSNGHTVGFLGDGINDAAALKAADVGISVDTAVDIARESAGVVLLEKDLTVLENGLVEGRKTYANMIKYIKMTASSNFGNMFSVLIASAFLPFLPMLSIHLLLLNLIYDISCTAIPWDHVDAEYLLRPRQWDASSISGFMLRIGPVSSVFDITTYLLMYFVICPVCFGGKLYTRLADPGLRDAYAALFQTGWFVESMWSQTLVIHMIRTPKIPFVQSRASLPVFVLSFAGIALLTIIPFTPVGRSLGLTPPPGSYFLWLVLTIVLYMLTVQAVKKSYIRRYGELL